MYIVFYYLLIVKHFISTIICYRTVYTSIFLFFLSKCTCFHFACKMAVEVEQETKGLIFDMLDIHVYFER